MEKTKMPNLRNGNKGGFEIPRIHGEMHVQQSSVAIVFKFKCQDAFLQTFV